MFLKKFRFNQFTKKHIEILGWDKLSEDIKTDKNKDEIEALLDDVDYFFEEDNTLVS